MKCKTCGKEFKTTAGGRPTCASCFGKVLIKARRKAEWIREGLRGLKI